MIRPVSIAIICAALETQCLSLAISARADDGPTLDSTRDAVISLVGENRRRFAALGACKLVWTRKTHSDGFSAGVKADTDGEFELWQKGKKVATKSFEGKFQYPDRGSSEGRIVRSGVQTAFNEHDFRNAPVRIANSRGRSRKQMAILPKPQYRLHENWLEIVHWERETLLEAIRRGVFGRLGAKDFRILPNGVVAQFRYVDKQSGRETILEHSLAQGGELARMQSFLNGVQVADKRIEYAKVTSDVWFPVKVHEDGFDEKSGKLLLSNDFTLEQSKCSFGDVAGVPDSVFEMPIEEETEVVDYRGAKRVAYSGRSAPMSIEELAEAIQHPALPVANSGLVKPRSVSWLAIVNGSALIAFCAYIFWRRHRNAAGNGRKEDRAS